MNYALSFCDITQISDNIFEVIDKEGVIIDKNCVDEVSNFWTELRKEPFGLLVNCQNSFSLSFEGACDIGIHPLQQNTAILVHNGKQEKTIQSAMGIKKSLQISYQYKIFFKRKKAIEWLESFEYSCPSVVETEKNITSAKGNEKEVEESEKRFRQLYERAPLPYQSLDSNGVILEINRAWLKMFGYQAHEVLGTQISNYVSADSLKVLEENFPILLTKGEVFDVNYVMIRKDGSTLDVAVNGTVGLDQEGNVKQTHCILQDITEKKRLEEKLRKSEQKFHTMADSSYDWEIWHAPDGKYLYISPSCERITGYSKECFLNDYEFVMSIVHPDDLEKMRVHREKHSDPNFESSEITYRIITKEGEIRWIWHKCHAAVGKNGEWLGRRTSNRDVTKLKGVEGKLRKSEKQLKSAQQIAKLGHWDLDRRTQSLKWSDEIYRIFSFEPQEFAASYERFLDMVHPEDRYYVNKSYAESIANKTQYDIEHRIVLKSGIVKWVRQIWSSEFNEKGRALRSIGVIHDITEIKALRGILPVCCVCGFIRDDTGVETGKGEWMKVDRFVTRKTDAEVSHGYCPRCYENAIGDL